MKVADIRQQLIDKYRRGEIRGGTVELQAVSFEADEDYFFKAPNEEYIRAELSWYATKSRDVNVLYDFYRQPVKIWEYVKGVNNEVNSNYGYLIDHRNNGDQYTNVLLELKRDPQSRRAVMIYTNPDMHKQYAEHGKNDFVCTNTVQYFNNLGTIDAVVNMRSNDVFFGYSNDLAWQKHVLKRLAWDLECAPGKITWQAGSFHVYERHFNWLAS